MREANTTYGAFVREKNTNRYKLLFTTELGVKTAWSGGLMEAEGLNQFWKDVDYDLDDIIIKQTPSCLVVPNWTECEVQPEELYRNGTW